MIGIKYIIHFICAICPVAIEEFILLYNKVDINVFLNYKAQLKSFSKKQFDPFCRRERISFKYNENDSVVTTVGQLNFFKWSIENDILKYIGNNLKDIEEAVGVPLSMKASNALHHEQYEIYDY